MTKRRRLPISVPLLGEAEERAVARVIGTGWITQGPEVAAFEREFAAWVGAPFACAVSSATEALHLALVAAGVGPGDEVITVSHTFIATANAIRYCGAVPVFVDIARGSFNIDPSRVEAAVGPRTRAIVAVHQLGMPCDLAALSDIARRRGLRLIEDAACAAGSEIRIGGRWERIGRPHGHAACFSFHPRKLLTTGDGGMITTADRAWDARFRSLRQHGMDVTDWERHGSAEIVFERYTEPGFNCRMTDLQAAVGRVQLGRLPALVARRREQAARYGERLADLPGVSAPAQPDWARSNWQTYCVRLPAGIDQRAVMQQLLDEGIATRRGVMCVHLEPAYAGLKWVAGPGGLAESEAAQTSGLMLPLFDELTVADQAAIVEALGRACKFAMRRSA